ncbi:hypothetical protein HYW20_04680 [Candidatus Woesearchaeota archaeon]|nr:hypothetical protein [Candidatus Woesearchaeota archaeon]
MHKLTLTIDGMVSGLSEKQRDIFQFLLKKPSGEIRGFVYFNKDSRLVRFETYEHTGMMYVDVSGDGTLEYRFESYESQLQFNQDLQAVIKREVIINGKGKAQLSAIFGVTEKVVDSLKARKPMDYKLPNETYAVLINLINNPETRTS